jgi:hypothetical protein
MADLAPAVVPASVTGQNAAWVVLPTRLDANALRGFCRDIERLFRLNPYLEFSAWSALGPDRYRANWRNLSNQQSFEIDLRVQGSDDGLVVTYDSGLKQSTRFCIAATDGGSTLTIIDDYGEVGEEEAAARLAEVDKSLTAWGEALRVYLLQERRWSRFAPYRWYRRALWLRLKPSARRIATLLVLFTLAEFVFLLFVVLIYWIEFS